MGRDQLAEVGAGTGKWIHEVQGAGPDLWVLVAAFDMKTRRRVYTWELLQRRKPGLWSAPILGPRGGRATVTITQAMLDVMVPVEYAEAPFCAHTLNLHYISSPGNIGVMKKWTCSREKLSVYFRRAGDIVEGPFVVDAAVANGFPRHSAQPPRPKGPPPLAFAAADVIASRARDSIVEFVPGDPGPHGASGPTAVTAAAVADSPYIQRLPSNPEVADWLDKKHGHGNWRWNSHDHMVANKALANTPKRVYAAYWSIPNQKLTRDAADELMAAFDPDPAAVLVHFVGLDGKNYSLPTGDPKTLKYRMAEAFPDGVPFDTREWDFETGANFHVSHAASKKHPVQLKRTRGWFQKLDGEELHVPPEPIETFPPRMTEAFGGPNWVLMGPNADAPQCTLFPGDNPTRDDPWLAAHAEPPAKRARTSPATL